MNITLEQIWHEFADKLRQFIRKRVPDSEMSEDILQTVFVKIAGQVDRLKDPSKLQSWIYLIARNAVIDYYRTRKNMSPLPEDLEAETEPAASEIEGLKASFRRMIDSLPATYRDALLLTEFEELTQRELAARLGIPHSSAKSRVQRARAQLKKMLHDCCRFQFDRRGGVIGCEARDRKTCPECAG